MQTLNACLKMLYCRANKMSKVCRHDFSSIHNSKQDSFDLRKCYEKSAKNASQCSFMQWLVMCGEVWISKLREPYSKSIQLVDHSCAQIICSIIWICGRKHQTEYFRLQFHIRSCQNRLVGVLKSKDVETSECSVNSPQKSDTENQ